MSLRKMIANHRAVNEAKRRQNVMLILDCSSSMLAHVEVATGHQKRRVDIMRRVVEDLRVTFPNVPVMVFGPHHFDENQAIVTHRLLKTGEAIPEPAGGTPLAEAITYAGEIGGQNVVVISDGEPNDYYFNDGAETLAAARAHGHKIDTVYIGPDTTGGEEAGGAKFLRELAAASGGVYGKDALQDAGRQLTGRILGLLGAPNPIAM